MIEFRSVSKRFPDGTLAVGEFNLVIPARQTTVLVGSSGSGKTTLLRMINRMVDPNSGTVEIDGESVQDRDPVALRRSIGYVMQNSGLMPHFTVIDNVSTVLRLNGASRREAHERARELLDTVGLDRALADRYPSQLSGGQQQRVGVARGLAADPNILLMDEPFGAVDPIVRAELQQELLRLQRELGKTVVFVTHDIDEALLLGDQIVILDAGARIVQQGSPDEILANPADGFVSAFIGADRGKRALSLRQTPHGTIVVDADGRTQGRLIADPPATAQHGSRASVPAVTETAVAEPVVPEPVVAEPGTGTGVGD
ncbi:ABC transporter ATP-binding protein [Leucobacter sp. OLJS4]|uniref:ABC transporter ATP-binding protein n=1 Tax=unclassified Leucobacter TaxID=2621730 RepID=UPI000C184257|nr:MULTISPECIES: ATP-binding cassette domain-containing protein [unclassified Leucobacter]PIJ47575.1 ABC transporter ATP-binding protein [Leucobacter sp. OLES1]PII83218.1 ABC transporter ATP-binding protein [Leucobacter sp. OLCALW19]PII86768.1 ABC transporter ATP-binding protein [Leucobacter sp. OLTLW20]PII91296.1 ABC transporter ATP-binding protein [Leucobacter sp. OLAS13]PII98756.1 ABC transporter ATP-binding protein [Leucobacter sp. OLDS2]